MLAYLLKGLTLGFAAGAQPGPLQTYLVSQSLSQGWRRTLLAAFGPLVSDGPIVTLVLLVLTQIPDWMTSFLYIAGGLFILYLAWGAFRQWKAFAPKPDPASTPGPESLWRAALVNALSPGPYLFWSLVNGPLLVQAWREAPPNAGGFLLGFYSGMIGLNAAIILVFGLAGQRGERLRRALLGASTLALAGFGLYQLWMGISTI
jgi:threonine/homoserine/homoserine lactone efflux protein